MGTGGNLIPISMIYPKTKSLGIDLSKEQIVQAEISRKRSSDGRAGETGDEACHVRPLKGWQLFGNADYWKRWRIDQQRKVWQ